MKKLIILCLFFATSVVVAKTSTDLILQEDNGVISIIANNTTWKQVKPTTDKVVSTAWEKNVLVQQINDLNRQLTAKWKIVGNEIRVKISSIDNTHYSYPWPFIRLNTDSTENLLIPVAEGIVYSAFNQETKPYDWLKGYAGYGLSLPLYGVYNDAGNGFGFFTETPDYFELQVKWQGQWTISPLWLAGKNLFGERTCRYQFYQENALVGIAKWYRHYLKEIKYLVPLGKKNPKNNKSQDLVAAPHLWIWDDPGETSRILDSLGIDKAVIANCDPLMCQSVTKDEIKAINKKRITGKYMNWEDCWPPELSNLTEYTEGWPEGLIFDPRGQHVDAWTINGPDGKPYVGAKLCSSYMKKLVAKSLPRYLKKYPLRSAFIDIMTGRELEECYAPQHPQDRSDDRLSKMAILKNCSKYVLTGSEKMTWWGIPVCHYSMGILSLNPYPPADDIGQNPSKILEQASSDYLRFDVGSRYRVPLFELIAHDCVLPSWYWGDGNNKHPATWREKDLLTILYGGIPMWCFSDNKELRHFASDLQASYQFVSPPLMAISTTEMVFFRYLNPDRTVQETNWSNGTSVIVNFSDTEFSMIQDGKTITIGPKSYIVTKK